MTRVFLIHALRESVQPINTAFDAHWPEADRANLLDDSLSADRARDGELTDAMIDRFLILGRYARDAGADAILFTCSAFGPAIDAVAADLAPMPVHKPNSAMIDAALAHGGRIGLMASFAPTLQSMLPEFPDTTQIVTRHCAGALEALAAGNAAEHDRIAAAAAAESFGDCTLVALAQFSLARAARAVGEATGLPVLTTTECAVLALRKQVEG
ncbi:arylsulfatase [Novosphingobium sp. AAP83]|uniref:aspartate/glutamate racemase family protein n=1 Tax=Novosphingobium sp. AAP83 TaxID=1523425 RepID=UPI0006B8BC56|nr:aspartate/glutamate racemase family protein [Novosphingobium sp. AAP83]KPF89316.1 arylsulfatase [Novosphingobium sp. AAP83]